MAGNEQDSSQVLLQEELAHFQLTRDPFAEAITLTQPLPVAQWAQHIDLLEHLLRYSNFLLIVTGEAGLGKSQLHHQLQHLPAADARVLAISARDVIQRQDLLKAMAQAFSVARAEEDSDAVQALQHTLQDDERLAVVMVDDAHCWPEETLETVLQFVRLNAQKEQPPLRFILFAEPGLEDRARAGMAKVPGESLVHNLELAPFGVREFKAYLTACWLAAGGDTLPFSQHTLAEIYQRSAGYRGRMVDAVREELKAAYAKAQQSIAEQPLEKAPKTPGATKTHTASAQRHWPVHKVIAALLLAIVVALVLFFQKEINRAVAEQAVVLPTAAKALQQAAIDAGPRLQTHKVATLLPNRPADSRLVAVSKPSEKRVDAAFKADRPKTALNASDKSARKAVANKVQPSSPKAAARGTRASAPKTVARGTRTGAPKTVARTRASTPKAAVKTRVVDAAKTRVKANAVKPVTARLRPVVPPRSIAFADRLIMEANPQHYTLQLMGSHNAQALRVFAKNNRLTQARYAQGIRNGKKWHVLLLGDYASRQTALSALENLPNEIRALNPWPRPFASVQAELRAAVPELR